jgi:hypothetical protein
MITSVLATYITKLCPKKKQEKEKENPPGGTYKLEGSYNRGRRLEQLEFQDNESNLESK